MDDCGDESAGFRYELTGFHLVSYRHDGLCRCAKVLGHGHIHGLRKRKDLYRAVAGKFGVIGMDAAYLECYLTHCCCYYYLKSHLKERKAVLLLTP